MTTRKQYVGVRVDQPGYDESGNRDAVTCFGLPGSSGLKPSMSSCHFDVKVAVYDDESVYVGLKGRISDPVVAASDYTSELVISPKFFTWSDSGSGLVPSVDGHYGYVKYTVDASDGSSSRAPDWASGKTAYDASADPNPNYGYGWYIWDFDYLVDAPVSQKPSIELRTVNGVTQNWFYAGSLSDFGASSDGQDGVLYIGGTGIYQLTNPVAPVPVEVRVPGFVTPAVVTDYYPFSIRKSGKFASANRTGGYTRIRKDGEWRDVKNNDSGTKVQAYVRKNGSWAKAPKFS